MKTEKINYKEIFKPTLGFMLRWVLPLILVFALWCAGVFLTFLSVFFPISYVGRVIIILFPLFLAFWLFRNAKNEVLKLTSLLSLTLLAILLLLILIEIGINLGFVVFASGMFSITLFKKSRNPIFFIPFIFILLIFVILTLPSEIKQPDKMLGFWSPAANIPLPFVFHNIIDSPSLLRSLHGNSVAIARSYLITDSGAIQQMPLEKIFLMIRAKLLDRAGINVMLNLEIAKFSFGKPHQPIPEHLVHSDSFKEKLEKIMIDNAKLAQELGIEAYTPMIEAELILGINESSEFMDKVAEKIKKVYSGKLVWWGAFKGDTEPAANMINFSSYDIICFTYSPYLEDLGLSREEQRERIEKTFEFMANISNKWNKSLMICELALGERGKENITYVEFFLDSVFAEASERIDGIFIFDFVDFPILNYFVKGNVANIAKTPIIERVKEKFEKFGSTKDI